MLIGVLLYKYTVQHGPKHSDQWEASAPSS